MAITCASPAYLRQYSEPKTLEELKHHPAVNYVSRSTAKVFPFEFLVDGELKEVAIEGSISVIDTPPPSMPVSVLYPHNRHLSPRVRVFVDWLGEVFASAR